MSSRITTFPIWALLCQRGNEKRLALYTDETAEQQLQPFLDLQGQPGWTFSLCTVKDIRALRRHVFRYNTVMEGVE